MKKLAGAVLLLWLAVTALADVSVPALSGRVVDQAQLLSTEAEARVSSLFEAHEQATGNQLVLVTLPDLQGDSIEEVGLALGRTWGIGRKDKDNGAILLMALADRQVRIEVGYGLEGDLTDARSAMIIHNVMLPAFRRGDFEAGLVAGAESMVAVLEGNAAVVESKAPREDQPVGALIWLILLVFVVLLIGGISPFARYPSTYGGIGGGFGGGRGGFGGGGFGGGGGGFGGGGASGGW